MTKAISQILAIRLRFRVALLENKTNRRENTEDKPINAVTISEEWPSSQKLEPSGAEPFELVPETSMISAAMLAN